MKTYKLIVRGVRCAVSVSTGLIARSQWFAFTPLPNGRYELAVKIENKVMLNSLAEAGGTR